SRLHNVIEKLFPMFELHRGSKENGAVVRRIAHFSFCLSSGEFSMCYPGSDGFGLLCGGASKRWRSRTNHRRREWFSGGEYLRPRPCRRIGPGVEGVGEYCGDGRKRTANGHQGILGSTHG